MPGSSRELAEIFGTSDDEFPFCLNVDKTFNELALPDARVSEFFLNSLNTTVSMDSALASASPEVAAAKIAPKSVPPREVTTGEAAGGEGKKEVKDDGDGGKLGEEGVNAGLGLKPEVEGVCAAASVPKVDVGAEETGEKEEEAKEPSAAMETAEREEKATSGMEREMDVTSFFMVNFFPLQNVMSRQKASLSR